jgi:cytochrome c oxidase assembly protein subunit 15
LLFVALIFVARSIEPGRVLGRVNPWHLTTATVLGLLLIMQIAAGAFVAGLDAGMGYNTWPLMDGAIIPNGLFAMDPAWRNIFENAMTVQFIHRGIAYLIVAYVAYLVWRRSRDGGFGGVHGWLPRIGILVLLQVCLGIATLLASVPISLAVGHQSLAFMLAGATAAYIADMRRVR